MNISKRSCLKELAMIQGKCTTVHGQTNCSNLCHFDMLYINILFMYNTIQASTSYIAFFSNFFVSVHSISSIEKVSFFTQWYIPRFYKEHPWKHQPWMCVELRWDLVVWNETKPVWLQYEVRHLIYIVVFTYFTVKISDLISCNIESIDTAVYIC